jgi:hypothetical protein
MRPLPPPSSSPSCSPSSGSARPTEERLLCLSGCPLRRPRQLSRTRLIRPGLGREGERRRRHRAGLASTSGRAVRLRGDGGRRVSGCADARTPIGRAAMGTRVRCASGVRAPGGAPPAKPVVRTRPPRRPRPGRGAEWLTRRRPRTRARRPRTRCGPRRSSRSADGRSCPALVSRDDTGTGCFGWWSGGGGRAAGAAGAQARVSAFLRMSASCSSIQSPGSRCVTIPSRPVMRRCRSALSIVRAAWIESASS